MTHIEIKYMATNNTNVGKREMEIYLVSYTIYEIVNYHWMVDYNKLKKLIIS